MKLYIYSWISYLAPLKNPNGFEVKLLQHSELFHLLFFCEYELIIVNQETIENLKLQINCINQKSSLRLEPVPMTSIARRSGSGPPDIREREVIYMASLFYYVENVHHFSEDLTD